MTNIKEIKIGDNNISYNNFSLITNGLISYKYIKNSNETVNKLVRKDHSLDRDKTIKHKDVNLEIEKTECPEYQVYSNGFCLTCLQIANSPGQDKTKKWYQNGKCVSQCSGNYSIYSNESFYCEICADFNEIKGVKYCGCPFGTVKLEKDGKCYLPEDSEIKQNLLFRYSLQCFRADGKTHNYCQDEGTSTCQITSISGYSFPYCICKEGYTGKYCEFKENNVDLNSNLDDILVNNETISVEDPIIISKIRGIIFFLEIDTDNNYIKIINEEKRNLYIETTIKTINNYINQEVSPRIYDVIELAVYYLYYNININRNLRNLQENRIKLDDILYKAHQLNYFANRNLDSNFNIQNDYLKLISFISYKQASINDGSFKNYIKNISNYSNIIGYIDLKEASTNIENEEIFVLTLFNRKLFDNTNGLILNFSRTNPSNQSALDNSNFDVYISSGDINVNFELAKYYRTKNISIYDKNDDCFKEPCFISKKFDFDLTQKYRKKNVYQKWSVGESNCSYHSFDDSSNSIILLCKQFDDKNITNSDIKYGIVSLTMKDDYIKNQNKVYNLPFRCPKKIDNISQNIGFWVFFLICILEIFYIIGINILTLGSLRKISIRKGLINDGFFMQLRQNPPFNENGSEDFVSTNKSIPYKYEHNENYVSKEIYNQMNGPKYNTFINCTLNNFKELHPLYSFFRVSIMSPLILRSWFFIFNSLVLLGFNALIYWEGLIENRIFDQRRNRFDYPMLREFGKIVLCILLQLALTTLIKLLTLVFPSQRKNFEKTLKDLKFKRDYISNDIISRIEQFESEMLLRRLIGGILMLFIVVFFFYYSVVFCGVYINTQKNLIFAWIWSLIWNLFILSPIYIFVISFLEYRKQDESNLMIYYMKGLFCF